MLIRLVIWILLACVGFAGGKICFREQEPAPAAGAGEKESLASWAATQPTALAGGSAAGGGDSSESERAIEEVRRAAGLDLGAAMLGYLRVVEETPLDGLEALLMESEKTMPETDIGGVGVLMRDAIVERLMAEDPDRLLLMVAAGKSDHLSGKSHSLMAEFLQLKGYDAIKAALAETQFPLGAAQAMREMLNGMGHEASRSKLTLEYGRLDPSQFSRYTNSEETINLILEEGVLANVDPRHMSHWFQSFYMSNPEQALSKLGELGNATYRQTALEGIGSVWKRGDIAGAQEFADGLSSDRMRVAFLSQAISAQSPLTGLHQLPPTLDQILQLEPGKVRTTLFEETLQQWKHSAPEAARAWADEHGQRAEFDRLILPSPPIPKPNSIDGLLESDSFSDGEFLFPE